MSLSTYHPSCIYRCKIINLCVSTFIYSSESYHMSWSSDALVIVFPSHKGDEAGETALRIFAMASKGVKQERLSFLRWRITNPVFSKWLNVVQQARDTLGELHDLWVAFTIAVPILASEVERSHSGYCVIVHGKVAHWLLPPFASDEQAQDVTVSTLSSSLIATISREIFKFEV